MPTKQTMASTIVAQWCRISSIYSMENSAISHGLITLNLWAIAFPAHCAALELLLWCLRFQRDIEWQVADHEANSADRLLHSKLRVEQTHMEHILR